MVNHVTSGKLGGYRRINLPLLDHFHRHFDIIRFNPGRLRETKLEVVRQNMPRCHGDTPRFCQHYVGIFSVCGNQYERDIHQRIAKRDKFLWLVTEGGGWDHIPLTRHHFFSHFFIGINDNWLKLKTGLQLDDIEQIRHDAAQFAIVIDKRKRWVVWIHQHADFRVLFKPTLFLAAEWYRGIQVRKVAAI